MVIQDVLASRVCANEINTNSKMFDQLRALGFFKLVYTDGYEELASHQRFSVGFDQVRINRSHSAWRRFRNLLRGRDVRQGRTCFTLRCWTSPDKFSNQQSVVASA